VSTQLAMPHAKPAQWARRHLLGLEDLSRAEIETILDTAEGFVEVSQRRRKKRTDLKGKVVVNLFFEPSTRTRNSFDHVLDRALDVVQRRDERWPRPEHEHKAAGQVDGKDAEREAEEAVSASLVAGSSSRAPSQVAVSTRAAARTMVCITR